MAEVLSLGPNWLIAAGTMAAILAGALANIRRSRTRSIATSPLSDLRQAAEVISAQAERRDLITAILSQAIRLSGAELAAILMRNDDSQGELYTLLRGQLRVDTITLTSKVRDRKNVGGHVQTENDNATPPYHPPSSLPAYYPRIENWVGTHLRTQGRVIGEIFMANRSGDFKREHQDITALLATQASSSFEAHTMADRLKRGFLETIEALVMAIEAKDPYTRGHSERVIKYAVAIAQEMGLSAEQIEHIRVGAVLHDVGKIGISEAIINKTGPLTDEEWHRMRSHPRLATKIIDPFNRSRDVLLMVYHHHESYDGRGYPTGLKGTDIPLAARILKVADSFEAMTSNRPYQKTKTFDEAMNELRAWSGKQFDPLVVTAFQRAGADRRNGLGNLDASS